MLIYTVTVKKINKLEEKEMTNRFKKVFIVAGVILLSTVLTACGGSNDKTDSSGGQAADGEMTIEVIAKGFQHDFWKAVKSGAEEAAKEDGVKMNYVGPKDEVAVAEQVEMINNAINKKPAAIALAALDTSASLDAITQAMEKNIPIIGFDSGVPGAPEGAIVANASTDNYKAGELAAEKTYEVLKDKLTDASKESKRIGVISQEVNSLSITQRTEGFVDKITELMEADENIGKGKVAVIGHDKFKNDVSEKEAFVAIEVRVPAEVTDSAGKTEAQSLLEKKDIVCIYGSNEFAAKSIINADSGMSGGRIGKDKVIAVGFDSGALQQDAIRNDKFIGSVTQNPVSIGYNAVKMAVKAAKGEKVEDVDTGSEWYDSSNIDEEDIQALLYE